MRKIKLFGKEKPLYEALLKPRPITELFTDEYKYFWAIELINEGEEILDQFIIKLSPLMFTEQLDLTNLNDFSIYLEDDTSFIMYEIMIEEPFVTRVRIKELKIELYDFNEINLTVSSKIYCTFETPFFYEANGYLEEENEFFYNGELDVSLPPDYFSELKNKNV